jgi:pSer/pThr/pTyr-binding forkhead associated (FHA) protein
METSLNPTLRHILLIEEQPNRVILLDAEHYTIGRNDSNAIVLDRYPISREHASLLRVHIQNENRFTYRIIDGDSTGKPSTNGVFVNQQQQSCYNLSNEDVIAFGGLVKAFYIQALMDEVQLCEYMEWFAFNCSAIEFSENLAAIRKVESYSSKSDSTSILWGGHSVALKETLVLE